MDEEQDQQRLLGAVAVSMAMGLRFQVGLVLALLKSEALSWEAARDLLDDIRQSRDEIGDMLPSEALAGIDRLIALIEELLRV